ncbi:hypothetical protein PLESTB_001153800 [Pleodorina starrii]|uniref:Ribosome-recycling factor, chloroplastic n=1 Tax=Pleodorina starrii TaxID=330485 RepID=A0A9W6F559_9CHLO|nr:hypothetical protein PLESTM_001782100 [Pleodorina starrii]GLC56832.1 hypothetical protein PLESTB_001153800 [Pleodorina starrii]GLC68166.1 hypothetical protein PLESTF_000655500 [Pleodorina starrii]
MYGRVRTGTSLVAWAARAAPSHAPTGQGLVPTVLAGCPLEACCSLGAKQPSSLAALTGIWEPLAACRRDAWSPLLQQQVATFASKGAAKHGRGGKAAGGGKGAADKVAGEEAEVPEFDLEPFVGQMRASLEHLQRELAGIRTGRASPGLLEGVVVADSSHGSHVPLRGLGTVVVRNPHLLVVEVYDPQDAQPVATAIQTSPLKLQARVEGSEVLVEVPRLTMDMVERMAKLAGQEAEAARAEVRRARHRALELAKRVAAAGGVSSEEARRRETQIQAATNQYIGEVDSMLKAKEKDLREKH